MLKGETLCFPSIPNRYLALTIRWFVFRYRNQVYISTQKIYNLGIERHESRVSNIAEFNEAIEVVSKKVQLQAIE